MRVIEGFLLIFNVLNVILLLLAVGTFAKTSNEVEEIKEEVKNITDIVARRKI